jgi:UDP-N-acetylglucosamine 2-epimerase
MAYAFPFLRPGAPLVLITGHRRESFGPGFEGIGNGIAALALAHPEVDLVYPVHLNPRVREPVQRLLDDQQAWENMARVANPFGDGHASERIADLLEGFVGND